MTTAVEKKIESLENELDSLKSLLEGSSEEKTVKLKGLLKGMKVNEEDFKSAEKNLFSS